MENSKEPQLSNNNFPNAGVPLSNQNFLQSLINSCPPILPNYIPQPIPENPIDIARLFAVLSPQQFPQNPQHKFDMVKFLESYRHMLPVPKQPFEQLFPLNNGFFNGFPPLPMPLAIPPYVHSFPMNLMESKTNSQINAPKPARTENTTDCEPKPKNRLLKRHYDDIKQETLPPDTDGNNHIDTIHDDEAPFGRSKCGKPLKSKPFGIHFRPPPGLPLSIMSDWVVRILSYAWHNELFVFGCSSRCVTCQYRSRRD